MTVDHKRLSRKRGVYENSAVAAAAAQPIMSQRLNVDKMNFLRGTVYSTLMHTHIQIACRQNRLSGRLDDTYGKTADLNDRTNG